MNRVSTQRGFSLVSVLVAIGLAGGLILVIMKLSENMTTIESRSNSVLDAKEFLTEMRLMLDDERYCRLSFAGNDPTTTPVSFYKNDIDDPNTDAGLPIEIWLGDAEGTARTKKKFSDSDSAVNKYGKLTIESMRLYMNNGTGSNYPAGIQNELGILRVKYSYLENRKPKGYFKDLLVRMSLQTNASGLSTIQSCNRTSDKAKTYKAFKYGNCTLSGYVNNFEQPVDYECPGNQALVGEYSFHDSGPEDRRYQYRCCDVQEQDGSIAVRKTCLNSSEVNQFYSDVNYYCPAGWIVTQVSSYRDDTHKDRRFAYSCCDYSVADSAPPKWSYVTISSYVNSFVQPVSYACPTDEFICGFRSHYDGGPEDRRYEFRCCKTEYQR